MSRAQRGRKEPVAKALGAEQGGTSAASSPNPPGSRGPACMSYGHSHLTQPQSCVTRSPFLGGGALCPLSGAHGGEGTAPQPEPGAVGRGPGSAKPQVSSAGSMDRQPVRSHSHALPASPAPASPTGACDRPAGCRDRRLPLEGMSRCHPPPSNASVSSWAHRRLVSCQDSPRREAAK